MGRALAAVTESPALLIWLTGLCFCAYVFRESSQGSFTIGPEGIGVTFEK